jgi:hypothetical protein
MHMRWTCYFAIASFFVASTACFAQMRTAEPDGREKLLYDAGYWHYAADRSMEPSTDRPGGDMQQFDLPRPDPRLCQERCVETEGCRAWTFVKPGWQARNARCWLKASTPEPQEHACCISGLNPPGIPEKKSTGAAAAPTDLVENATPSSMAVRTYWGLPEAFAKFFVQTESGEPVVVEIWDYFSRHLAHVVIDGEAQALTRVGNPPADWSPQQVIDPESFVLGMNVAQVAKLLKTNFKTDDQAAGEFQLFETGGIITAFENGRLVYVDTGPQQEQR